MPTVLPVWKSLYLTGQRYGTSTHAGRGWRTADIKRQPFQDCRLWNYASDSNRLFSVSVSFLVSTGWYNRGLRQRAVKRQITRHIFKRWLASQSESTTVFDYWFYYWNRRTKKHFLIVSVCGWMLIKWLSIKIFNDRVKIVSFLNYGRTHFELWFAEELFRRFLLDILNLL